MKPILFSCCILISIAASAQTDIVNTQRFCQQLQKIIESGKKENFESLMGMNSKQSPLLPVPGPSMKLEGFPVLYIDKDNRFVGKTNQNFDSLSAAQEVEKLKVIVSTCLDSTQWVWLDFTGDDSSTVFFKEVCEWQAVSNELTLTVAAVKVAGNVYSANLYMRRNKR